MLGGIEWFGGFDRKLYGRWGTVEYLDDDCIRLCVSNTLGEDAMKAYSGETQSGIMHETRR